MRKARKHIKPTDMERPLTKGEKLRRKNATDSLRRRFPGLVILGRYGKVQWPRRYGFKDILDKMGNPTGRVTYGDLGPLYGPE